MADQSSKAPTQSPDAAKAQEKKRRPDPPVREQAQGLGSEAVALGPLLGSSAMDLPVERHSALLRDPRFSHPANAAQRARIVSDIQRAYGNAYVQRVLDRIDRSRTDLEPDVTCGKTQNQPAAQPTRERSIQLQSTVMRAHGAGGWEPPRLLEAEVPKPSVTRSEGGILTIVYFAQDRYLLDSLNFKEVEKLSEELLLMSKPSVTVDGYASAEGKAQYNMALSEKRRQAVIAILGAKLGRPLEASGAPYGERKAVVKEPGNLTLEMKEKQRYDRRVEIMIVASPADMPKKPTGLSLPALPALTEPETLAEKVERNLKLFDDMERRGELKPPSQTITGDKVLDKVLEELKIPDKYHGIIKNGLKAAGEKALDSLLNVEGVRGNDKKMIKKVFEGIWKSKYKL